MVPCTKNRDIKNIKDQDDVAIYFF
jgi:hypothetical protein